MKNTDINKWSETNQFQKVSMYADKLDGRYRLTDSQYTLIYRLNGSILLYSMDLFEKISAATSFCFLPHAI